MHSLHTLVSTRCATFSVCLHHRTSKAITTKSYTNTSNHNYVLYEYLRSLAYNTCRAHPLLSTNLPTYIHLQVKEAKKYYPLFGMFANVALVFSGQFVRYVSQMKVPIV